MEMDASKKFRELANVTYGVLASPHPKPEWRIEISPTSLEVIRFFLI